VKIEYAAPGSLKPHPRNPRVHPESAIEKLARSIKEFGWTNPVLVSKDGFVLAGHARLKAAKEAGIKKVPILHLNLEGKKAEAYLIADNKLQEDTRWDIPKLKELLVEIDDGDLDLKLTGFDEGELKDLIDWESEETKKEDEVPEPPKKAITKPGDLWILGEHRLLCGDSTQRESFEKILKNNERTDLVFADPPYGINYGEKNRFLNSFQKAGMNLKDIANDMLGKNELFDMLVKAFSLAREFGKDHCSYYVTAPQGGELGLMMMMMSRLQTRHILIWNKNCQNFSLGRLSYEYKHEPILFTWKKTHKFYGGGTCKNSVWDIAKETKCAAHPTMKPVALVENCILNSSKKGDIVLDHFCGSGTTIVACEKTGRAGRGIELEPAYCDVIAERWQNFSGKKAIRKSA